MSEAYNVEGLSALVSASNALAIQVVKTLKQKTGLVQEGISLAEALLGDEAFKTQIQVVVSKFGELSAEVKDLSTAEVTQLIAMQLSFVPQLVDALKA